MSIKCALVSAIGSCAALALLTGCNVDSTQLEQLIQQAGDQVNRTIDNLQNNGPGTFVIPSGATQDNWNLAPDAQFINNFDQQVTPSEVSDTSFLAFDNQTGFDIYLQYTVDGTGEAIFVADGETALLQYPCIGEVVLDTEDDFDPVTGDAGQTWNFNNVSYSNPYDFGCGDLLLLTINPDGVSQDTTTLNLF